MAYIMNESGGDFQQVATYTSQPVAFSEHSWTSDWPQKQASEKADQSTCGSGIVTIS